MPLPATSISSAADPVNEISRLESLPSELIAIIFKYVTGKGTLPFSILCISRRLAHVIMHEPTITITIRENIADSASACLLAHMARVARRPMTARIEWTMKQPYPITTDIEPLVALVRVIAVYESGEPGRLERIFSAAKNLHAVRIYHAVGYELQPLPHLKILMCNPSFNAPIDALADSPDLMGLHLGDCFNHPLDALAHTPKLNRFELCGPFNQPIDPLRHTRLSILSLRGDFNQSLEPLRALTSLKFISFGDAFNQSVEPLTDLFHLTKFLAGHNFNQPVDAFAHKPHLDDVRFGKTFDQSIDALATAPKLRVAHLGPAFTRSLDPLHGLLNLEIVAISLHRAPDAVFLRNRVRFLV